MELAGLLASVSRPVIRPQASQPAGRRRSAHLNGQILANRQPFSPARSLLGAEQSSWPAAEHAVASFEWPTNLAAAHLMLLAQKQHQQKLRSNNN